jgi:exosortase B
MAEASTLSTLGETTPSARTPGARLLPWLPVVCGLALLFVPTFIRLSTGAWTEEAYSHGPIILAIVLWLFWTKRQVFLDESGPAATILGTSLLIVGLLVYVVGRSQSIDLFEVSAQIPVLAGVLLLMLGWQGTRKLWFPLLFMTFLIPLPGFVIWALTGTMKALVSVAAENLLYLFGYPIARTGVMIMMGPYQLLVADACAGLNSLYSLTALGLLYLYVTGSGSRVRAGILLASIVPIAFIANVMRVVILALLTFHFGEEAGQGFIHGLAGIVLFVIALLLLFAIDAVLRLLPFGRPPRKEAKP